MTTKYLEHLGALELRLFSGKDLVASCRFLLDSNKMPKTIVCDNISTTPAAFRYWLRTVLATDFATIYGKCSSFEEVEDCESLFR